nr:DMT family transporter [Sphaerochaetaceae bacterium]
MEKRNELYGLLIILQSFIFALVDVFCKIAFETVPVFVFATFRMGLTALILFLLYGKTIREDLKNVSPSHYMLSASCLGLSIILSNVAVHVTAATSFAFIRSLTAIIAPFLMTLFFHRKYTVRDVLVQATLVLGLYLLCAKGGLSTFGLGEILAFSCATLVAITLVFGADSLHYVRPYTLTFLQMALSCLMAMVAGLFTGSFFGDWGLSFFSAEVLGILAYCIFIGSLLAYTVQNIVLSRVSAKTVGILQCAYPVFTALVAYVLLGEKMTGAGVLGSLIIIVCITVQSLQKS